MLNTAKKTVFFLLAIFLAVGTPLLAHADGEFNPQFIISDQQLTDYNSWNRQDIQDFLASKGSYLSNYQTDDGSGTVRNAADIIYNASQTYQINPKFLLVTLQKEQSLVTDDGPTEKQLDWATGFGVCDSCSMDDPKVMKYKGFGKQVDNAAGIMRWYYQNEDKALVKKMGVPIIIDDTDVIPQSWATAFLYTYTPHFHGNKNFWRIWNSWFAQLYPNGTLVQSSDTGDYWLIQNNTRRKFKTKTALITRLDPKLAISVPEVDLQNYTTGPDIVFPNYALLRNSSQTYLLDYDTLRPFASDSVVTSLGFNPDEVIDVQDSDLSGYTFGSTITASTTAPRGVIYKVTDLGNALYLLKDNILYPITDAHIVDANYSHTPIEKHVKKDLNAFTVADVPVQFNDGTLIQRKDTNRVYVIDNGKKRPVADDDTFLALGYKRSNVVVVDPVTAMNIPDGDTLYINRSLTSSKNKFLGDSEAPVYDLFKSHLPAYLLAEYPSGRIISGKNIDTSYSLGGLTQLMTSYEVLNQNLSLDNATAYDAKKDTADKKFILKNGDQVKNKDLLNATLLGSFVSPSQMLARAVNLGSTDLVNAINDHLAEWGADNTKITDLSGVSHENKSSPRDLLKIFTKLLENRLISIALNNTSYTFREFKSKDGIQNHTVSNENPFIGVGGRTYRILESRAAATDAHTIVVMVFESKKTHKQYTLVTFTPVKDRKHAAEGSKIADWISTGKVKISSAK